MKIMVLGASGMLGSMTVDVLSGDSNLRVMGTVRDMQLAQKMKSRLPEVEWRLLDVDGVDEPSLRAAIEGADFVINAIGMTKPYTHDDNAAEIERAVRINALFPHTLALATANCGARVLQIATDCVYDGRTGGYVERSEHNATDVYGKTKSLGECLRPTMNHMRCSIVGPEPKAYAFLLEWFRRQPEGATVTGYRNHQWNGITTLQFARLCRGIIVSGMDLPNVQHIVPTGSITKYDLLHAFAKAYGRTDVAIDASDASKVIDRTLSTEYEQVNRKLWEAAGYSSPPSIEEMVVELGAFDFRLANLERESPE